MKKIISIVLVFSLVMSIFQLTVKASNNYENEALILKELGLFKGSNEGFELEREANRLEGLVMLIRLIGKEDEALAWSGKHPFSDVPEWGSVYVGYAYETNIANGTSATTFGSEDPLSSKMYFTFLLRALNYNDKAGEFLWSASLDKAQELGLLTKEEKSNLLSTSQFLRDDCAYYSYKALNQPMNHTDRLLLHYLIDNEVVDEIIAKELGFPLGESDGIRVEGSIKYVPLTNYDQYTIEISNDVVHKAFPEAYYWMSSLYKGTLAGWKDFYASRYSYYYEENIGFNTILPGARGGYSFSSVMAEKYQIYICIFDENYELLGYHYTEKLMTNETKELAFETIDFFDDDIIREFVKRK